MMIRLPRRSRLPRWLLTLVLLGAVPFVAQASPYTVTFVPGVHDADRPAFKLDASGAPHVVWHALEASPILLRYATFDGADWTIEIADTIEIGPSAPSLQLASGMPVVVDTRYQWALHYAERTAPGTWSTSWAVTPHGCRSTVLALDAAGTRHIFYGSPLFEIAWAYRTPQGTWPGAIILPDQNSAQYASTGLAADAAGDLHACFQLLNTISTPKLQYAERIAGTWHFPEPVATISGDAGASLEIGPDGLTTISAQYAVQGVGLYHRDAPNNWSFEAIDAFGTGPTSLAWDAEGRAHVAYVKAGAIWQAVRPIDGAWVKEPVTVPGAGESDAWPRLALDPNGDASIAFVRSSPREGGGTERALGIAHDVKTLAADPDATTDKALAIDWIAPQPSRGAGRIALRLAQPAHVTLELVAASGRRVAAKALGPLPAGPSTIAWDPGALAPGVYLLRALDERGAFVTRRWVAL